MDFFGYICEAFGNVAANISEIQDLDITGQIGVVGTFKVVKTNKQDCVWAPFAFVSIFLELFILLIFHSVILFVGIFNIYSLLLFIYFPAQKITIKV